MRVTTLGTGSILTDRLSSCFIVDRNIMIDAPNGSVKAARRAGFDLKDLSALLITHFHADHFFDIVFLLLELGLRDKRETDFLIVGPPGIERRTLELFDLAYPESRDRVLKNSRAKFVEVDQSEASIAIDDYVISPLFVEHTVEFALGYKVASSGVTVGFSGDSEACTAVREMCASVSAAFLDTSFLKGRKGHMGLDDVLELRNSNNGLRVIATHMSDEVSTLPQSPDILLPRDGDHFDF